MTFTNKVVPKDEQETVIQYSRCEDTATIYTTDSTVVNKLNKKYERTRIHRSGKQISAIEYDIPKSMVSFRTKVSSHSMSKDEKEKRTARLAKARGERS